MKKTFIAEVTQASGLIIQFMIDSGMPQHISTPAACRALAALIGTHAESRDDLDLGIRLAQECVAMDANDAFKIRMRITNKALFAACSTKKGASNASDS